MSVRALEKINQCEPELWVKVVPIKYTSITQLNLLTFRLSTRPLTKPFLWKTTL